MVQAPKPSSSREKVDGPGEPALQVLRGTGGSAERRGRDEQSAEKTREPGVKMNKTVLFAATWAETPRPPHEAKEIRWRGRAIARDHLHAGSKQRRGEPIYKTEIDPQMRKRN